MIARWDRSTPCDALPGTRVWLAFPSLAFPMRRLPSGAVFASILSGGLSSAYPAAYAVAYPVAYAVAYSVASVVQTTRRILWRNLTLKS